MEFGRFLSKCFVGLWLLWLQEGIGKTTLWLNGGGWSREGKARGSSFVFLMEPCPWVKEEEQGAQENQPL